MARPAPVSLTSLLHGHDRAGLVARVSGWIYENGGNILHADQHRDAEEEVFFQRVVWVPGVEVEEARQAFLQMAREELGMDAICASSLDRPKVALFVSKIDHCFHDILLRWKAGEYPCDIVAVISNHPDLEEAAAHYGVPFHHIPVTKATKLEAENRQVKLLHELEVELVIMARYMQILSEGFLGAFHRPVINIHHSFLPAFIGARPYHQAHRRGVKLIGATAHYATEDLDEGPIIQQAVAPVNHRDNVDALVRKGRDLEKIVLAQAVRWHLEHRVLRFGNKTVVFD